MVTHYAQKRFNKLLNKDMLSTTHTKVSMFLTSIGDDTIHAFRKAGFKAYDDLKYELSIDINSNVEAFGDWVYLTSTPEQAEYDNKHWDNFYRRYHRDKNFLERKKDYLKERDLYLDKLEVLRIPTLGFIDNKYIQGLIEDYPLFLKYNLENGSKKQYASYVPHIHTTLSKPLTIEQRRIIT